MWKRWFVLAVLLMWMLCITTAVVIGSRMWQHWTLRRTGWRSPHVRELVAAPAEDYIDARWSFDGRWIAAVTRRVDSAGIHTAHLLLLQPDGTLVRELPTPTGVELFGADNVLAWRPDGLLTIVADITSAAEFERHRWQPVRPDRYAIFLIDPQRPEQPPQRLANRLAPITSLDWSPDGQQLLVAQEVGPPVPVPPGRDGGLMVYDESARHAMLWQQHATTLSRPRWRPDGKEVLYEVEDYDPHTGTPDHALMIRSWPQGIAQQVDQKGCMFDAVDWSPDGRWLLYRETCTGFQWGHQVMGVAPREQPLNRIQVCDDQVFYHTDWGPHGQVLGLMAEYPGRDRLYICDVPFTP